MKNCRSFIRDERGFVLIGVGAALVAFLSLFALVVDFGYIFATKSQLQNTTDAAALAAAVEIPKGLTAAEQKAIDFGQSHWVAGSPIVISNTDVQFGKYNFLDSIMQYGLLPTDAVTVTAKKTEGSASGAVPLFFARLFGKEFSNVQAKSTAALDAHVVGVHGKNRLIPYSTILSEVDKNGDGLFDVGSSLNIFPNVPGNFGYLDLNDGPSGTPELRQYIEEGYDSDFIIPPGGSKSVFGSTGIDGESLINSFKKIIGEVVFLPVHSAVSYQGSLAVYNVVNILAVKIKSVKLTGAPHTRRIDVDIIYYASSVLVTDPNAPVNNSVAKPRLVA